MKMRAARNGIEPATCELPESATNEFLSPSRNDSIEKRDKANRSFVPLKKRDMFQRGIESPNGERPRSATKDLPLPWGEGWGEGEPCPITQRRIIFFKILRPPLSTSLLRSKRPKTRLLNTARSLARLHWPAILRYRLWRSFLQLTPNHVTHDLLFSTHPRVPESQDFDASPGQPGISLGIQPPLLRSSVLAAIEFDIQHGFNAEKIENVRRVRMLASKFICRKPSATKPGPQKFFRPRIVLAKRAGDPREFGRSHVCNVEDSLVTSISRKLPGLESPHAVTPHPDPLPWGEGTPASHISATHQSMTQSCRGLIQTRFAKDPIQNGIDSPNREQSTTPIKESFSPRDLSRLGSGERFACREGDKLDRGKPIARVGTPLRSRGLRRPSKRERASHWDGERWCQGTGDEAFPQAVRGRNRARRRNAG